MLIVKEGKCRKPSSYGIDRTLAEWPQSAVLMGRGRYRLTLREGHLAAIGAP